MGEDGTQEPPPLDGNTYRTWSKRWIAPGEDEGSPFQNFKIGIVKGINVFFRDRTPLTPTWTLTRLSHWMRLVRPFLYRRNWHPLAALDMRHTGGFMMVSGPRLLRTSWHLEFVPDHQDAQAFLAPELLSCWPACSSRKSVRSFLRVRVCAEFQIHPGTIYGRGPEPARGPPANEDVFGARVQPYLLDRAWAIDMAAGGPPKLILLPELRFASCTRKLYLKVVLEVQQPPSGVQVCVFLVCALLIPQIHSCAITDCPLLLAQGLVIS